MTNLDRLKGTPYLIDGFESFLKGWLAPVEPDPEPLSWSEEEMALVRSMPEAALQFYEVVQRWPVSKILVLEEESRADELLFPPQLMDGRSLMFEGNVELDIARVAITVGDRNAWVVDMSLESDDFGKLYIDRELEEILPETVEGIPMEVPVDEFLISMAFYNMIIGTEATVRDRQLFLESTLIFTGRYAHDETYHYYFHPDGLLWIGSGETNDEGIFYGAVERPSL